MPNLVAGDAVRLAEILPWFAHNALIHYLSPRGLEQYSGGAEVPMEAVLARLIDGVNRLRIQVG